MARETSERQQDTTEHDEHDTRQGAQDDQRQRQHGGRVASDPAVPAPGRVVTGEPIRVSRPQAAFQLPEPTPFLGCKDGGLRPTGTGTSNSRHRDSAPSHRWQDERRCLTPGRDTRQDLGETASPTSVREQGADQLV